MGEQTHRKLLEAFWETRQRGVVLLTQDWFNRRRVPPLYLEPGARRLESLFKAQPEFFGERSTYFVRGGELHFLIRPEHFPNFDIDEDRVFVAGAWNDWKMPLDDPAWELKQEGFGGRQSLVLRVPPSRCFRREPIPYKFVTDKGTWLQVAEDAPNRRMEEDGAVNFELNPHRTGNHVFYFQPEGIDALADQWEIVWKGPRETEVCPVSYGDLVGRIYSHQPLGALAGGSATSFRIFAPRASAVRLRVAKTLDFEYAEDYPLEKQLDATWFVRVPRNLHGWYYHYHIEGKNRDAFSHFDGTFPVLDPYAAATVCREGPGIILDPQQIPPVKRRFTPPCWHDLIILEAHLRDLVKHAPYPLEEHERMGFKGLTRWLREPDCYLRTLGVNAVELQPVQEFDNERPEDYHWGYMTVNFFAPESSYATKPEEASQVREFQELVQAFHDAGIAVILDVVYNHVGEPNHLLFIDKSYYFDMDRHGKLSNWSGCGNDFRAHAPMAKRLIIDSLKHLIQTYDVDGFRFDLAELIGVDVLREVEVALKAVKPSIVLIAEPWSFRGHIGHAMRHSGFASWNDSYRDFLLDYVKGQGNRDGIKYFLLGSRGHLTNWPAQTVNYTESHDDRCWLDKVTENPEHNGSNPTTRDRRRTHLMLAVLMSSFGIPMLAEGQDFLRSKHGKNNTYIDGDENALDYNRIQEFPATHEYFREWIAFRRSDFGRLLRLESHPPEDSIRFLEIDNVSSIGILYNAAYKAGSERLLFTVNPHEHPVIFDTCDIRPARFTQLANHERFDPRGLRAGAFNWEHQHLHLPSLSCGLWLEG